MQRRIFGIDEKIFNAVIVPSIFCQGTVPDCQLIIVNSPRYAFHDVVKNYIKNTLEIKDTGIFKSKYKFIESPDSYVILKDGKMRFKFISPTDITLENRFRGFRFSSITCIQGAGNISAVSQF